MIRPSRQHPRRKGTLREPLRVIRVLTEGEVTEPDYLTLWARLNRHNVRLDVSDSGMTPDALVRRAKQHLKRVPRSKRWEREFDEIWCVFDVDQHANVASHQRCSAMRDQSRGLASAVAGSPCGVLASSRATAATTRKMATHTRATAAPEATLT